MQRTQSPIRSVLPFLIVTVLLCTVPGYGIGIINQAEQLPGILRAINHSYLSNDAIINWLDHFGPRYYYFQGMALVSKVIPLPALLLGLLLLASFGTIAASFRLAQLAFEKSRTAPYLAAVFTAFSLFGLSMPGGVDTLTSKVIAPEDIARALLFWAAILAWQRRYVLATCLALPASLIHPLVTVILGGTAFTAALISEFQSRGKKDGTEAKSNPLAQSLVPLGALLFITWFVWLRSMHRSMPDAQFIDILAFFRHPHHYVPTSFKAVSLIALPLAVAASLLMLKRDPEASGEENAIRDRMRWSVLLCVVAFVFGYVFVELIPIRTVVAAQLYRACSMMLWMLSIAMAGVIGAKADKVVETGTYRLGDAILLGTTPVAWMAWPLYILLERYVDGFRQLAARPVEKGQFTTYTVIIAVLSIVSTRLSQTVSSNMDWVVFCFTCAVWYVARVPKARRLAWTTLVVVGSAGLVIAGAVRPKLSRTPLIGKIMPKPTVSIFTAREAVTDIASKIKALTPADAILITPPNDAELRYVSDRAIVVDVKVFSFQDEAITDWYDRIQTLYGPVTNRGNFDIDMEEMEKNYHALTDDKLRAISAKYGAHFAVIYNDTPTSFPALAQGKKTKLIEIKG